MMCALARVTWKEIKSAIGYRIADGKLVVEFEIPHGMNGRGKALFN